MRRWKRVQTADGVRFRSVLEPHEGALLHDLATSVLAMLDDREAAAPPDELAELTGIRTGNPAPPADATPVEDEVDPADEVVHVRPGASAV